MRGKSADKIIFDDLAIQTKQWNIAKELQHLPFAKFPGAPNLVEPFLSEEDLLAYNADNDLLAAVWELRYGDAWVRVEDLAEEGFMVAALLKLRRETDWVTSRRMQIFEVEEGKRTITADSTVRTYRTEDGAQHTFLNPTIYQVKAPCR